MNDFDKVVQNFFKNYQDRGMKKWAGFFLSDHTMRINKDKEQRAVVHTEKPAMSEEKISSILTRAFASHLLVAVQLKEVDANDQLQSDVVGYVEGCQDGQVFVSGHIFALTDVNNVEIKTK
ncbi:hypothetical protein PT285_09335 [Lactobacillus sp. ESL0791]|uniref:hypothetical protein n=1 Tax=Lactobacillus sp. ESL0791 TaxID=2983234 RepID=UPI0023F8413A|nr:hypothetical protein [Lactobacillus sp. ESL0791]MDF7639601.1 hypothetical protein [Lactobacillus sp. ESL0791]